ncbi:MAG: toll/interleukin-1 receptor domain-containing protein [Promethearchaeota archaeon]
MNQSIKTGNVLTVTKPKSLGTLVEDIFITNIGKIQTSFKAYQGGEPFLFVSYSHIDKVQVYPIIKELNRDGFNIWFDEGIPISENWKESIAENIDRCIAFLVFITPNIIDSDYVRKEISFTINRHKPFFAVYLEETELPSSLAFEIADIQAIQKYKMMESEFDIMLKEVLSIVKN